jgi:gas vesicle protein
MIMNNNQEPTNEAFVFVTGLVIGALTGLAFGLLAAPYSGAVTRRKIIRSAGEARDQVAEVFDDLEESGKGLLNEVKRVTK